MRSHSGGNMFEFYDPFFLMCRLKDINYCLWPAAFSGAVAG
jgi:hypothetical protein